MFRKRREKPRMAGPRPANRTVCRLLLVLLVVGAPVVTAEMVRANGNTLHCMPESCTNMPPWEMYRLKSVWDHSDVAITTAFIRHELQSQIDGGFWYAKGSNGGMECFWEVMNECDFCYVKWRDYAVLYDTSVMQWYYIPDELPLIFTP